MGYRSATALRQAIRSRGSELVAQGLLSATDQVETQFVHDRFLCRVFSGAGAESWMLKGGAGVLARAPLARRTTDIDLASSAQDLNEMRQDLLSRVSRPLGDFLVFRFSDEKPIRAHAPHSPGLRCRFRVFWGTDELSTRVSVDLVSPSSPFWESDELVPVNRIEVDGIPSFRYHVLPTHRQIAEKVCAVHGTWTTGPSTRVKDMIDIVILATTQTVRYRALQDALVEEHLWRGLPMRRTFTPPPQWRERYSREASRSPATAKWLNFHEATDLIQRFLTPPGGVNPDSHWNPSRLVWE